MRILTLRSEEVMKRSMVIVDCFVAGQQRGLSFVMMT